MVRSTLLWLPRTAAPKGGNRGGHHYVGLGDGFRHFSSSKNQERDLAKAAPNTSRCVDSDSAIDSLLSDRFLMSGSHFLSRYDDIGVKNHKMDANEHLHRQEQSNMILWVCLRSSGPYKNLYFFAKLVWRFSRFRFFIMKKMRKLDSFALHLTLRCA